MIGGQYTLDDVWEQRCKEHEMENRIGDVWVSQHGGEEIAVFDGFAFSCIGIVEPGEPAAIHHGCGINTNEQHGHWKYVGNMDPIRLRDVLLREAANKALSEQPTKPRLR